MMLNFRNAVFAQHNIHHDDHDHDHDHDGDLIALSIVDFLILILCIPILIHFIKYILDEKNYNFGQDTLFRNGDIICFISIALYGLTIFIVVFHDILHFVDLDTVIWDYHYQLGIIQWILFFMARITLHISFTYRIYSTFWASALKYNNIIYSVLYFAIICLFGYGIYIIITMWINKEILSPLSNDFTTMLIFIAADFTLIMVISYLFISKLYIIMKLHHKNTDSFDDNLSENKQIIMKSNDNFLNAISKYSLLTTIISIVVFIQLFSLWFISVYYHNDNELHVEYLKHTISTLVIFIDIICLYLSCRLSKKLFDRACKHPHKCCIKLCQKALWVNYKIFNSKDIEMQSNSNASSPLL